MWGLLRLASSSSLLDLREALSVCSERGFLQAKIGPVDRESLSGLTGRIQTEPGGGPNKHFLIIGHTDAIPPVFPEFFWGSYKCKSLFLYYWNTHLLKYSTSLSVSSMSVLSRSMSLGRNTSSERMPKNKTSKGQIQNNIQLIFLQTRIWIG